MDILIACEESQAVCKAFRENGHNAYSCDIQDCSGGHPEWHLKMDVEPLLNNPWDMIIAFPPCTHLASSGALYWKEKQSNGRQQDAINFVKAIAESKCSRIAIENPVGILSTVWRKPDQIINPYQFGDPYKKRTCLWLKNLPTLAETNVVEPVAHWTSSSTRGCLRKDGTRNPLSLPATKARDAKMRSKTFPGIAKAMADQWGRA